MAYKFEIVLSHFLQVTDTTIVDPIEAIVLDMPKADAYYNYKQIKDSKNNIVHIYDKNGSSLDGSFMWGAPLSECVDENGVAFTKTTFVAWMRSNTGFKTGSGGSGSIIWNYTATNYTDLTTNVAPTANEGEIALVYKSQGVWLVNRKLKGLYIYQSGVWEYANQELQNYLSTALQPSDNISLLTNDAGYITNGMSATIYDPNNIQDDAFDYANFLGTFQIKGGTTTVNMSSDKDNLNVDGSNIVYLTTSSQDRRITGIKAPPSGVNRKIYFMNNSSQYRVKFVHQSGNSLTNNRIVLRGQAGTRNLLQYQMTLAVYNHTNNKWYLTRIG